MAQEPTEYSHHVCIMIKTNALGLYFTANIMNQIRSRLPLWRRRQRRDVTAVRSFDERWNLNMQSVDAPNCCCTSCVEDALFSFFCAGWQKPKQMVTRRLNRDAHIIYVWVIYLELERLSGVLFQDGSKINTSSIHFDYECSSKRLAV